MKILELFSGYGTATFALKRLGIEHEVVGYSDIDKYANQCFQQNHGGKELGDVKLINPEELPDFNLLTGGFPCQAFSNAGKMQGELEPRGTLFYEIIRIAEVKKPKFMLLENVKGLTCKKFKDTFNKILSELDRIGYDVYWKVLNSKDFGIPQSRARVWFVCFRKDIEYDFKFPESTELKIFFKDLLDKEVDKWYYKSQEQAERLIEITGVSLDVKEPSCFDIYNKKVRTDGISITLTEPYHNTLRIVEPKKDGKYRVRKMTDKECFRLMGFLNDEINLDGLSDTQRYKLAGNGQDVNVVTKIFEQMFKFKFPEPTELKIFIKDILEQEVDEKYYLSPLLQERFTKYLEDKNRIVNLQPRNGKGQGGKGIISKNDGTTYCLDSGNCQGIVAMVGQLRRLTPKECFRLMGFLNDEINLDGLSDTQRYKLAGNGQDVNVVTKIFEQMFKFKFPEETD
jgi:DNA (cytosine-5)-methyltransferase 1